MAFFLAPSVSDVLSEVKLRPEQVRATFTPEDYEADVANRIVEETAFVQVKIGGSYADADLAALSSDQLALATKAVELLVAASLYHTAGQLNEAYKAEALDYERRAGIYLDLLALRVDALLGGVDSVTNGAATLSTSPYRIDELSGELVINA